MAEPQKSPTASVSNSNPNSPSPPPPLPRKHPAYVTVLHLSDLHFAAKTPWPKEAEESVLGRLLEDVKVGDPEKGSFDPDILCVTGDLAENPLRELIKRGKHIQFGENKDLKSWEENLRITFENAHQFLLSACKYWKIEDPAKSLFVIPGNHDLRIWAFTMALWLKIRLLAS